MNAKALVRPLMATAFLSVFLLSSPAGAVEPEKQPLYSNIPNGVMCGTQSGQFFPPPPPTPCTVPAGRRLIIDHVSGYVFRPTSTNTTVAVSLVVTDAGLGLAGAAFHTFVATKTNTSNALTDVFTFSIPFRMMLHPGATFYFSPAESVAVSGYLVKQ
jgi:hypothetical protein